jgi:hypothetical protein
MTSRLGALPRIHRARHCGTLSNPRQGPRSRRVLRRRGGRRCHRRHRRFTMRATKSFNEVAQPDVVVVPGGLHVRTATESDPVVHWLRQVHPTTTWTASVCTGPSIWRSPACSRTLRRPLTGLSTTDLNPCAHPTEQRVIVVGKIITAGRVSGHRHGTHPGLVLGERRRRKNGAAVDRVRPSTAV